ncbi:hypothetical protein GCM10010510_52980 [Streptomyces anandii JCM 4720]|nr:hypothetical protein GCM10010510_52980 [Streptomyces anandii JCM 4720]
MEVNKGGVMGGIGKRMEPNRMSIRLLGDVVTTTPCDDAEVTELTGVQVQV